MAQCDLLKSLCDSHMLFFLALVTEGTFLTSQERNREREKERKRYKEKVVVIGDRGEGGEKEQKKKFKLG